MKPSVRRKLLAALRGLLGLALFWHVGSTIPGWSFARAFFGTAWLLPALAVLLCFGVAVESIRMSILFRSQNIRFSFLRGCRLVMIGAFFSYCLPGGTGGDMMKLYYLVSENRGKGVETATVLLVDRVVALFSLLLVLLGLALLNVQVVQTHYHVAWLVTAAACGAMGLLILATASLSSRLRNSWLYSFVLERIPFHQYVERASNALFLFREYKGTLLRAVLLSTIGHFALVLLFVAMAAVFVPGAPPETAGLLALVGMLANALPITPGGLGVGEAAFEGLFRLCGHVGGAQLIIAWRVAMAPVGFLGFLLFLAGWRARTSSSLRVSQPSGTHGSDHGSVTWAAHTGDLHAESDRRRYDG